MCYLHGDGLEKDEQKAFVCFYFAAWYGCVQSQTELACLLITGSGTDLNLDLGISWMKWAASQGEVYALSCMANFCEQGKGMQMNKQDAHMYLQESKLAYDIWQKELTHTYPGFGM